MFYGEKGYVIVKPLTNIILGPLRKLKLRDLNGKAMANGYLYTCNNGTFPVKY